MRVTHESETQTGVTVFVVLISSQKRVIHERNTHIFYLGISTITQSKSTLLQVKVLHVSESKSTEISSVVFIKGSNAKLFLLQHFFLPL